MTAQPSAKQFLPTLQRSTTNVFAPVQREFDRLFDQLSTGWNSLAEFDLTPRMDVRDTKEGLEITVELPGIAQDDVKIEIDEDILTVSGEKKAQSETEEKNYRISERTYGAFSRSMTLPRGVDADKIKATLRDGVLTLVAPKNGATRSKAIKIQAAK